MARKSKAFVLDSWAVLAFLQAEAAGQKIADLIGDALEQGVPLLMSVVNVGEVWYIFAREISEAEAEKAIESLRHLGIEFIEVDWKLARQAAAYKANRKMSYADCFAAALAKENKAELVTGDKEFKQVESEVQVRWV